MAVFLILSLKNLKIKEFSEVKLSLNQSLSFNCSLMYQNSRFEKINFKN